MTEETFTRELERHADQIHSMPLSFEDVRGRARGIRRRRRGAAMAAAAVAVVAIAVPTAILSGSPDSRAPEPAPPVSPTTPGASVLHDGVLTLPDGSTVALDLDNEDVLQLGVLTDGRIVTATQKPYAVRVYGPDGALDDQYPVAANVITMSAADDAVAWVAKDLQVRVLSSGSAVPVSLGGIPMPGESAGSIDAVLDPEHLLVGDHTTTSGELTSDGMQDLSTSEPFRVEDVSPDGGLWAVSFMATENEQFGCSGLYDPVAAEVVARSCDTSGLEFAPDGKHLIGTRGDNNMVGNVTTVDLDLSAVGEFAPAGKSEAISRVGWADPSHLLASVADWKTSQWTLLRVGLDTDTDTVDGPAAGRNPEMITEYVISD